MTRPSAKVIRLDRAPAPKPERDAAVDRAKGSFKLDLHFTVCADPQMQPSDLALITAYTERMEWPRRLAWLSIAAARAMTGLSERQVNVARGRLLKRGYLEDKGKRGVARLFKLCNPRAAEMRDHVSHATASYREQIKDRQSTRRRKARICAEIAPTDSHVSQHPGDSDVCANSAGNVPIYTPQYLALKKETHSQGYGVTTDDDPDCPFPIPVDASEADHMLSEIIGGRTVSEIGRATLKARLAKGDLSPADVERWRALHDGVPA